MRDRTIHACAVIFAMGLVAMTGTAIIADVVLGKHSEWTMTLAAVYISFASACFGKVFPSEAKSEKPEPPKLVLPDEVKKS